MTLCWLQRGIVTIPKASSRAHIQSNIEISDFALTPKEFDQIDNIARWERVAYGPLAEMAGLK